MKKFRVPIFTEEYAVIVYVGTKAEIIKGAAKYLKQSVKAVENDYQNCRGRAWNALDTVYGNKHPLIVIDSSLPAHIALATIAHESSHALDFIEDYIGLDDRSGEFHGHGISAVMRAVNNVFLKKK